MIVEKHKFWAWAHSQFLSKSERAMLAEYIVGNLLGCLPEYRSEHNSYILRLINGKTIKVKSAAYLQNLEQNEVCSIKFDISEKTDNKKLTKTRSADFYVFAVFSIKSKTLANPLIAAQWFFIVAPTIVIDSHFASNKTVNLLALENLGLKKLQYQELAKAVSDIQTTN